MSDQYAVEKFTRCPHCRSFSLKKKAEIEKKRLMGTSSCYACKNCGNRYSLKGNNLLAVVQVSAGNKTKETARETTKKEPAIKKSSSKVPFRKKYRNVRRAAFFFIPILVFIAGTTLFLTPGSKRRQTHAKEINLNVQETKTVNKKEEIPVMEAAHTKETSSPLMVVKVEELDPATENKHIEKGETENAKPEPVSYKVFDLSWIKVRKTYPNNSDKSFRWAFSRKTIYIKRSKNQKVFIAGDSNGNAKWAVDDVITVNGKRMKGVNDEITGIGVIPQDKRRPPLDITSFVPPSRETALEINLVDYGVFWGNTPLYVVVM